MEGLVQDINMWYVAIICAVVYLLVGFTQPFRERLRRTSEMSGGLHGGTTHTSRKKQPKTFSF